MVARFVARQKRQRFATPPEPKGPKPTEAILWAQTRAGLQGKWERDLDADVQRVISESLAQGLAKREIMKRLKEVFPSFGRARLENIARTETATAYSVGRLAGFRASQVVKAVQFAAILDDRTTDMCEKRDGRIMLLSDPKLNENTPPLHYQCRSNLVPLDKYDLEDLQKGVPEIEERFFGWLDAPGHPRNWKEASDWSHLPEPLAGFGGPQSLPKVRTPLPAALKPARPPAEPKDPMLWEAPPGAFKLPDPTPALPPTTGAFGDRVAMLKADMDAKLDLGHAWEFEKGRPPAWEDLARHLGFGSGPKPESVKGKGDGELKLAHWKKVHPHEKIFEDPDKLLTTGKKQSAGVILIEDKGVWLVEPQGHFGGYVHTFPKGGVDGGLTHQQTALKELWEETGMQGELLAFLGEYAKTTSQTKLYIGKKTVGFPWNMGWESQKTKLVPWDKLEEFLDQSTSSGKKADLQAAADLKALIKKISKPGESIVDSLKAYDAAEAAAYAVKPKPPKPKPPSSTTTAVAPPPKPKKASKKMPKLPPAVEPVGWETAWDKLDQTDFGSLGSRKGSNPGGLARYKDGSQWYVKQPKTSDHARNEHLAAQLYRLAGVEMPEVRLVEMQSGQLGLASRIIDGLSNNPSALLDKATAGVREHFAVDAWLGNWDVVGATHDNLLLSGNRAVRIDVGGSLLYRAQGDPKGAAWNDLASEWFSMRTMKGSTSSNVFAGASGEELFEGVKRVAAITPDQIRAAVERSGFDDRTAEELIRSLVARQKSIVANGLEYGSKLSRGTFKTPVEVMNDAKNEGLHKRQGARRDEMAAMVGMDATNEYGSLWANWQNNSNSTGGIVLREEWERIQKGQPPKRPEIRATLAANQVVIRNTFAADRVTLYRGFTWGRVEDEAIAAAALGKKRARLPGWELTSWSADISGAFHGVVAKAEFPIDRIAGGMGITPGFNKHNIHSTENEYIVGADDLNGPNSFFHVDLADVTGPSWGPGRKHKTIYEYVDYLRLKDPARLASILSNYGGNQTLSKRKRKREEFANDPALTQPQGFESGGMMGAQQIQAETDSMAASYAENLAKIRESEARGEVFTLGQGATPEEFLGQGPWGRRRQ